MFTPKLFSTLKTYNQQQLGRDVLAGLVVAIVALPLAIAFSIASGVSPEKGLYTAVIAGFIISAFGGSRVQIGGPTGAFIVVVYGIVQVHGFNGLVIATFMAGIMLIMMGLARLGSVIKYLPYPLITGFTSGIALIIFASQVKDFLGLKIKAVPVEFIDKWTSYAENVHTVNPYSLLISITTAAMIMLSPRFSRKIPGSLIALVLTTIAVQWLQLPVETIGSRFGAIPSLLPKPSLPHIDYATIKQLIQPAFTIALLGGIESLLSAVVADGMIGGNHKSNIELVAQGAANIGSSIFGGIPATGAIARTATNVKNGGRTPIAGMVHAISLAMIMLFAGKYATLIPMATLAGILVVVAYNMSEWENFISFLKGPKSDRLVLLVTFVLTVLVDLTVAIEIGMVLAAFLFLRHMIKSSNVTVLSKTEEDKDQTDLASIPRDVEVFEIAGPLFFGAAYKFKEAMKLLEKPASVLIIRMRQVPNIDATGLKILSDIHKDAVRHKTKLILSEVHSDEIRNELKATRLLFAIGKANVTGTFTQAIERSKVIMNK
ncbi:SulP family inorganic anion transporter [Polluticoccus soli]|uniref:SulP family inorganic anion transporter n=1 Tax=Polluticoccus soli TaxID=3034150 RepID=UPI0023E28A19|nr:SulP family inorganic anion transporter [Flavipsychrobacter sp. JY13-12]